MQVTKTGHQEVVLVGVLLVLRPGPPSTCTHIRQSPRLLSDKLVGGIVSLKLANLQGAP